MSQRPRRLCALVTFLLVIGSTSSIAIAAENAPRALTQREVVALVIARVLPESIAADIAANGIKFQPTDGFVSKLQTVGANAIIVDALRHAKSAVGAEQSHDDAALDGLLRAGGKAHQDDVVGAAREIVRMGGHIDSDPDLAFVMADLFERAEQFDKAAFIYSQIATTDAGFPEIHTKLAYALYEIGDSDRALIEARLALARTPNNAEAHKNLALALADTKQFDAAIEECQQALKIKPDYTEASQLLQDVQDEMRYADATGNDSKPRSK
jgi:tetratricopeptide (TPR) repeat protein